MTDNVIPLGNVTSLDRDPDQVLQESMGQFDMQGVVIMGYKPGGELYFASSIADGGSVLWLMEMLKKRLLEIGDDDE